MPEPAPAGNRGLIAMIMIVSAVSLVVLSVLIYMGVVPLPDETRAVAALVVGVAAFADFVVAIWFFRMGQSS
jgi:hypothetical protein